MFCILFTLVSVLYAVALKSNQYQLVSKQPHIVFIVADDLGWNDVSWNNPTMITPNLESLARTGVILNQSYVQPICNPSRSALMTGYYPYRLGRQNSNLRTLEPTGLSLKHTLLPEKLRQLGYSTHAVGKWHLGFCNWKYTPTYRGFDSFFGYYNGAEDYYQHSLVATTNDAEKYLDLRNDTTPESRYNGTYSTQLFTKVTIDLISKLDPRKPTFFYLPFQSAHAPLEVPQKYSDLYKWIKNEERRTYCGMVSSLDEAVGRLVEALKKRGFWQNTLLVFTTDNGGQILYGGNNYPLRGNKNTLWEGGTRGVAFVHGWGLEKKGYVNENLLHIVDWYPTLIGLAGGSSSKGGDGVDQWKSISRNKTNVRKMIVYNIFDKKPRRGAIRIGDYKLVLGKGGEPSGWYPPPNNNNGSQSAFEIPAEKDIQLYDLRRDPNEFDDISDKYPKMVSVLLKEFKMRSKEKVPADEPPSNPRGHPKYFDNVFSPGWCNVATRFTNNWYWTIFASR